MSTLWTSIIYGQSVSHNYRPAYIPLDRSVFQSSHEQIPDLSQRSTLNAKIVSSQNFAPYSNQDVDILIDGYEPEEIEKKRLRRDDTESSRLLSTSAFSKISETLGKSDTLNRFLSWPQHIEQNFDLWTVVHTSGALNTVGRFLVNMTRGQEPHIQNSNPSDNVPDAILTLSKTVLGQNVTKIVEPLIKGTVGIDDIDEYFDDDQEHKKNRKKVVKKDVQQAQAQPSKPIVDNSVASVETTTSLHSVNAVQPGECPEYHWS